MLKLRRRLRNARAARLLECDPFHCRCHSGPHPAAGSCRSSHGLRVLHLHLCRCQLDYKPKLEVPGSGISTGHPVGATCVRIMATLLHEMERRDAQFGLETMCIGGGQGIAAVIERVS